MISAPARTPRKRGWRAFFVFLSGSTLLHLTLLPLLIALLGVRIFLPKFEPEIYHVTSSAIRIERIARPLTHSVPNTQMRPRLRPIVSPPDAAEKLTARQPRSVPPSQPVRVAYRALAPIASHHVAQHQLIDPKALAAQERMYAATIAAAQAANNPLSISKLERSPSSTMRASYNFAGAEAASRHGDGILYPTKRWTQGHFIYYLLRYTVHYPSGDYETGEVPWPVHYTADADPFAQGDAGEHIPLPGPAPDFVASTDTVMKPLIAHCYRLREQYCDIMPSPQ